MAITTLAKVKIFVLGSSSSTTHDTRLTQLQAGVEAEIESFCKRTFGRVTDATVILDGSGRNALRLPVWPVASVASVRIDATGEFGDGSLLSPFNSYFILDGDSGLIRRRNGAKFPSDPACVRVVYTGGYTEEAMPADLQACVHEAVADRWHRSRQSESGSPATMQTFEATNFQGSGSFANEVSQGSPFPISVERILRSKYRVPF